MVQKTYFKTKDYCKVKFTFNPENAETVEIFGLNNDWNIAVNMKRKKDGSFWTELNLPKDSEHQFRYRINSIEWYNEPEADSEVPNTFGSTNSYIKL